MTIPPLPSNIHSFSCTDWGGYTPRGYSPCVKTGVTMGIAIEHFKDNWLDPARAGKAGSTFIFYDKNNNEVGRTHMPSYSADDRVQLTYTPTK